MPSLTELRSIEGCCYSIGLEIVHTNETTLWKTIKLNFPQNLVLRVDCSVHTTYSVIENRHIVATYSYLQPALKHIKKLIVEQCNNQLKTYQPL